MLKTFLILLCLSFASISNACDHDDASNEAQSEEQKKEQTGNS